LEECDCNNEIQAKERANFHILKMKPNLNDEKMAEKSISDIPTFSEFKPNIFGDKVAVMAAPLSFEPEIFGGEVNETISANTPATKDGKYVCFCKKSYSHRSSYYKHTSTCLQYQHNQSMNKLVNANHHNSTDSVVSVSIISTTTTTTTTRTTTTSSSASKLEIEEPDSRENDDEVNSDDDNRIVRYRFKSKKKAEETNCGSSSIFHYSNVPEVSKIPVREIGVHVSEKYNDSSDTDDNTSVIDDESSVASSSSSLSTSLDDIDNESAATGVSDAASSAVSELLTEQNEKLKDYIRKMISALTIGKKRNKKSIVNSLVFELLDQNKTLQKQIVELSKERNIIVNNTNNNQFNLNFFLNEQCKDAVNLSDFVNSLEITMDDLTYTRNQGLVEGISKVMIDGLKQMDLYKRPIHCTDQKRDTIYVRDNHQWAKDEGNARMRQAFVDIANKEYFAIKKWMDLHPGWESNSRLQDFHHKMMKNVLHEIKDDPVGERKIMKSIEREIFIEK
jgi:ferritin